MIPIIQQVQGIQNTVLLCDANTVGTFELMIVQYYAAPVPLKTIFVEGELTEELIGAIKYYHYTAISFVSNNPSWELVTEYTLDDGQAIQLNTVYYVYVDDDRIVHFLEEPHV